MNSKFILKSGTIINEGKKIIADILINGERIERIDSNISDQTATEINCEGKFILPGIIDDQVHFREPGLTHSCGGWRHYFFYGNAQCKSFNDYSGFTIRKICYWFEKIIGKLLLFYGYHQ